MSQADRLIEALAKEGALVSAGEFTLDRVKAREKMRSFQLADPRMYVLLLVQAAVCKGAGHVDFTFDSDDMRLQCDGHVPLELGGVSLLLEHQGASSPESIGIPGGEHELRPGGLLAR